MQLCVWCSVHRASSGQIHRLRGVLRQIPWRHFCNSASRLTVITVVPLVWEGDGLGSPAVHRASNPQIPQINPVPGTAVSADPGSALWVVKIMFPILFFYGLL